jgi:hypothetical protein
MERDKALRRMLSRFHRPWYRRLLPWALFGLALIGVGRIALVPVLERWTRETMAALPDFHASYREAELFTSPLAYVVDGLHVDGEGGDPVLSIERLEVHASWGELVRAAIARRPVTVRVRVARPRLVMSGGTPVALARAIETWAEARLPAMNVELAAIEDGEIVLGPEQGTAGALATFLGAVNASAQRATADGPFTVKGTAAVLGAGDGAFRLTVASGGRGPVSGELLVRSLALADLYWLVEQALPAGAPSRAVALRARFTVKDGDLQSTLRAGSQNLTVQDLTPSILQRIRARFDAAAPWVTASPSAAQEQVLINGSISPAGTGPWLETLAAARALIVEGVAAAVPPPAPPEAALEPSAQVVVDRAAAVAD